uniref:hypothetical protein n=1 Tax=uncultured Cardiobacterium sp. TaxID=417619 RepID=UPI00263823CF
EEEAFESLVGEALNHCKSLGCLCIVSRNDTQVNFSIKRLQIGQKRGYSLPIAAHIAAIGIDTPPIITKRTGALQRCFYARFLWQRAWENLRVRRFLVSGSVNPAFAVALLLDTKGDRHPFTKEPVMSCHITLVLGDATDTAYETFSIYAAALLRILTLANTDPDTCPSARDTRLILDLIEQIEAQKDAAHAEVMRGVA